MNLTKSDSANECNVYGSDQASMSAVGERLKSIQANS